MVILSLFVPKNILSVEHSDVYKPKFLLWHYFDKNKKGKRRKQVIDKEKF